ncbi:MAG: sodium:solute symporter family protein [Pirellulales bacterium]|nr:sodium:solute symporter family protein [Pirellulales bacterium]
MVNSPNGAFTGLDWAVLFGYFVGITAFGLWIARRIRTSGGYFLGDRKLPWWIMVGQSFGTGTHAENPVGQTGAVFEHGFATIWYQWKNMLITPFYWLMAPWYRRCERTTIGELVGDRYGSGMALLYTLFALAYFVLNQGAMMKGAGKVISMATGGEIVSPDQVVVAMVAATVIYSVFGGLVASAYTDFVQGFLIIVLSFMLIPTGLEAVGGFSAMRAALPESFFEVYSEVSGVNAFVIAMLTLNGLVGITAQPHILSMNATGATERAGRVGQTYGSFVKRACTIGWAFTGLIVATMVVQQGVTLKHREDAFGYACLHLLGPGFVGLMVACVLAANMSTCSNFLVNSAALFTQNIYKQYFRANAEDGELLLVGRLSALVLISVGVLFALVVEDVLHAFLFLETLPTFLGVMIMGGFLWRRANRQGAMAATIVSFAVYAILHHREAPDLWIYEKWLPVPYGWSMLAGLAALVIVSLITRPEDPERITRFFDNQQRTTDEEGLPAGQPKPLAAERGQDLVLLDLPGWFTAARWQGFWGRYREDLVGFSLAWLSVGALVLSAWAIMQIGK